MDPSTEQPNDDFEEALSATLDAMMGPVPEPVVEEQAPLGSRPPLDSGAEEERYRTFPARYGG